MQNHARVGAEAAVGGDVEEGRRLSRTCNPKVGIRTRGMIYAELLGEAEGGGFHDRFGCC